MQNLTNKIAVITGAANGIGRALAFHCAKAQMRLVLADCNATKLEEVNQQLLQQNVASIAVVTDVTCEKQMQNLVDQTLQHFGTPDFLFNNAGVGGYVGAIWELTAEKLQWVMQVNFLSVFYGIQKFIPLMLAANKECHVINTASMAGLYTFPHFSSYVISKHAVVVLSECLYHDLATKNSKIKVAVLCPGGVRTNILEDSRNYPNNENAFDANLSLQDARWIANFAKLVKNGLPPERIAEEVFQGIQENKFYIMTDNLLKETVRKRYEAIMQETQPAKLDFQ